MKCVQPARKPLIFSLIILCLCCCAFTSHAQNETAGFKQLLANVDSIHIKIPGEKIYMQFVKPAYILGDTIWFKGYLFNATYLTPTTQSGILYIDLADEDNKLVRQFRLPVQEGITWGNIALNQENFKEGTYTLRAYTSWLRNFGDDYFFYRRFSIAGTNDNSILVKTRTQFFDNGTGDSVRSILQLNTTNDQPLSGKPLQLSVLTGKRTLFKSNVTSTQAGIVDVNFTVPAKHSNFVLTAQDNSTGKKVTVPLQLNRPSAIDLQFMPEGGNLIAGLPAHIGFKAISEDGRGINVKGIILNSAGKQVATFQSLRTGMGSFDLVPVAGETYSAQLQTPGGGTKTYTLPLVNNGGLALAIINKGNADSLQVTIATTQGYTQNNAVLIAQAGDVVCYAGALNFTHGNVIYRSIAKNIFPAGIARFTILTQNGIPLNQRLVYITSDDSLRIDINAGNEIYNPRDSIALSITSTGADNKPIAGNFSLAVTDDAQVRAENETGNIISRILLSSDLKGYVEEPTWYFQRNNDTVWQALDNLLLTQGWATYNWQQAFSPQPLLYAAEHSFTIKGRVTNIFNKGLAHTAIDLFSKKPAVLIDTLTDDAGQFVFTNFPAMDTPRFVIQARNKKGKSFNVGVDVETVPPPAYVPPVIPQLIPWYVNTDTTLLALTATRQQLDKKLTEGLTLAPVTVFAHKTIDGSLNLNGNGNADQVFNEADMDNAGKKTLRELLLENVKGFRIKSFKYTTFQWYYIGE